MGIKENETVIEGIIDFTSSLYCHSNIMGKEIEIDLDGIKCSIAFPKLPYGYKKDNNKKHLIAPRKSNIHKNINDWGQIHQWPQGYSGVEKILLLINVNINNYQDIGNNANITLKTWKNKFEEFLEIKTNQILKKKIVQTINLSAGDFDLWINVNGERKPGITKRDPIIITKREVTLIEKKHVIQAVEFANEGKGLNLSYKLIKKARRELDIKEFRTAIIDAATSCEITLFESLTKELSKSVSNKLLNELINKKYKTLSSKMELGRLLSIIPDLDYTLKLIEPRNKAVHKGYESSFKEANETIKIALKLADSYYKSFSD